MCGQMPGGGGPGGQALRNGPLAAAPERGPPVPLRGRTGRRRRAATRSRASAWWCRTGSPPAGRARARHRAGRRSRRGDPRECRCRAGVLWRHRASARPRCHVRTRAVRASGSTRAATSLRREPGRWWRGLAVRRTAAGSRRRAHDRATSRTSRGRASAPCRVGSPRPRTAAGSLATEQRVARGRGRGGRCELRQPLRIVGQFGEIAFELAEPLLQRLGVRQRALLVAGPRRAARVQVAADRQQLRIERRAGIGATRLQRDAEGDEPREASSSASSSASRQHRWPGAGSS